jgi:hypothetical protein
MLVNPAMPQSPRRRSETWNRPFAPWGCKSRSSNADTSTEINAAFATFVRERPDAPFVGPRCLLHPPARAIGAIGLSSLPSLETDRLAACPPQCRVLRLAVFRCLLVCMLAHKSPASLFAVSLETGRPEHGTPDLTELRKLTRPFPKNAAERDCYRYLLEQMQATPNRPPRTRDEFESACRQQFQVTVESFDYCWREAIKVTRARWDQPGRRPR